MTTVATEALMPIHHRMPVILPPESYETWMVGDVKVVGELMVPHFGLTEAWPVATLVNNVRNDGSELVEQAKPLALPPTPAQSQLDLF
jgi:putative SOS response-associated peptidase YedK